MNIENIELKIDVLNGNSFEIKSHPKNYSVTFINEEPSKTINKILNEKIIIIDKNIADIYKIKNEKNIIIFEAIEENKVMQSVLDICIKLDELQFKKDDVLYSIGGGIIQDVTAMTCKLYKRGIKWNYFPTTLLSICDSCIGGKAALNNNNVKNQLALFTSPNLVTININFINTLKKEDINSGYGEILKLFAIGGDKYIDQLDIEDLYDNEKIEKYVKYSLAIKKAVIEYDEFENKIRKSLNYGHTLGHAIESAFNYSIPHGIAIIYGMFIVNKINNENEKLNSKLLKFLDKKIFNEIINDKLNSIIEIAKKDKKNINKNLFLIRVPQNGICIFKEYKIDENFYNLIKNINI